MSGSAIDQVNILLAEVRDEVARAEAKAATLFAATGVLIAVIAAILTSDAVDKEAWRGVHEAALGAGGLSILAANVALAASIWPRRATATSRGWPRWFGEVALEARRSDRPEAALRSFIDRLAGQPPDPFERACHQLWNMSLIAYAKQGAIRVAVVLFGAGVFLTVVASTAVYLEA